MVRSVEQDGLYILLYPEDVLPLGRPGCEFGGKPTGTDVCICRGRSDEDCCRGGVLEILASKPTARIWNAEGPPPKPIGWSGPARWPVTTDLALRVSDRSANPTDGSVRGVPVSARRHSQAQPLRRDRTNRPAAFGAVLDPLKRRTSSKPIRLATPFSMG